jgi:phenylacetate-CoA ligase
MIVVDRSEGEMDTMEVWVEVSPELVSDEVRSLENMERKIAGELHSLLGISLKVKLVEPKSIPRSEGKAKRVVDRRDLYK